jgi:hypothetical protein
MGKINKDGYKQGFWKPSNPQKLLNENLPFYRSKLEADYMRLLDRSPKIKKWGSELYWISYKKIQKDGTVRNARYFVDFIIETSDGKIILAEIKPQKQINNVKLLTENKTLIKSPREKISTWNYRINETLMNIQKWKTAKEHCDKKGWEFQIWSEKDLKNFQTNY